MSMEFSRQEYWSGLLFPSQGDLPNPGIKPKSPALAGGFFTAANAGDLGLILGLGKSVGERNSNPLHYSCLENSTDIGAW